MILDGFLQFSAAAGDSPTTGSQTSTNQIDLGITGLPSSASGGGARDIGIGDDPAMKFLIIVTTAFTGGTSLQINIQGAPDNGSGAPGSFVVYATGPAVVEASLIAGARLFDTDMPRPQLDFPPPRYLQLGYVSVGTHGAGALKAYLVLDRHDLPANANAVLGGYPPGIVIAN